MDSETGNGDTIEYNEQNSANCWKKETRCKMWCHPFFQFPSYSGFSATRMDLSNLDATVHYFCSQRV